LDGLSRTNQRPDTRAYFLVQFQNAEVHRKTPYRKLRKNEDKKRVSNKERTKEKTLPPKNRSKKEVSVLRFRLKSF
jgi:hypothetical protein